MRVLASARAHHREFVPGLTENHSPSPTLSSIAPSQASKIGV